MKAIILAGGEGTRLRPLTGRVPKPMVRMFDRPVAEHIVRLLKAHGISEIGMSLMYLPYVVSDYFGDGNTFGVGMRYHIENTPLGTAGGVREFEEFYRDEDFLVISGDAVCDFDLTQAMAFHRDKKADATIVLYRHDNPLEYGLVLTREDGRIDRFIEKPSWGQVFSDQVNTGIYILSAKAINSLKRGKSADFAKDLFPLLMSQGAALYGYTAPGYWCDMGDSAAYLKCVFDALSGRLRLDMPVPARSAGVYVQGDYGKSIDLETPCYISREAVVEAGAKIGPYAVVQAGGVIGPGASIEYSVCSGHVGSRCEITGAVIDTGAVLGNGCVVGSGAVIGADVKIGADALIREGVRLWPSVEIERGAQVHGTVPAGVRRRSIGFEDGILVCESGDMTAETCGRIGSAMSAALRSARTGVGASGCAGAAALAAATAAGCTAAGGDVLIHDGKTAAEAAALCGLLALDYSVFIECGDESASVHIYDRDGLIPRRDIIRKIELALSRGETATVSGRNMGCLYTIEGAGEFYAAGVRDYDASGIPFRTGGDCTSAALLERALRLCGCVREEQAGTVEFRPSPCGRFLEVADEKGSRYDYDHTSALAALAYCKLNPGATLSVAYTAPSVFDDIAVENGATLLRVGRDGEQARQSYIAQVFTRDAAHAAALLSEYKKKTGSTIAELAALLPRFTIRWRNVTCRGDRGRLMRLLSEQCADMRRELHEGLRLCLDGGWVHISPLTSRQALRITGEGMTEEFAEELCADFSRRVTECDTKDEGFTV